MRCGTRTTGEGLARYPTPTCPHCGYKVFKKVGGSAPRDVKAE